MRTAPYDTVTRITVNPADRWIESGRDSRSGWNLPTSYTVRTHTKKTTASCWETVAELGCRVEKQVGEGGHLHAPCRFCLCWPCLSKPNTTDKRITSFRPRNPDGTKDWESKHVYEEIWKPVASHMAATLCAAGFHATVNNNVEGRKW
jgi:hypothetical protein